MVAEWIKGPLGEKLAWILRSLLRSASNSVRNKTHIRSVLHKGWC